MASTAAEQVRAAIAVRAVTWEAPYGDLAWRIAYHRQSARALFAEARATRALPSGSVTRRIARRHAARARANARLAGYFTPTSLLHNGKARRHA
jgi:hypothetical protein